MICYSLIRTTSEVDLAVDLVRRVYTRIGYINPQKKVDLAAHTYLKRADAATIVATSADSAIGTISIITNQQELLPMYDVYGPELDELIKEGYALSEIRRFAIDGDLVVQHNKEHKEEAVEETDISLRLLAIAIKYALHQQCDFICFMIKPGHRLFYEALGAKQIGDERPCPAIDGKPVLGYKLDIRPLYKKQSFFKKNFLMNKILSEPVADDFFSA